jgi:hypothetical protein
MPIPNPSYAPPFTLFRWAARSCGRSPGSQCGDRRSGTSWPSIAPVDAPFAPGKAPKRLSKLRFSIIR